MKGWLIRNWFRVYRQRVRHTIRKTVTVGALLALVLTVVGCDSRTPAPSPPLPTSSIPSSASPTAKEIDISHVGPGNATSLTLAERRVEISVPAGEGHTFGSFRISDLSTGFSQKKLERDGSLYRAWIGDVTSDGVDDAVIVIQSGGSGSYADVYLMETTTTNFAISRLPEFTASGYMGHDEVCIQDASIVRSFPSYVHEDKVRIDRQWKTKDALDGKLPVRKKPDSNASPSGATKAFRYDGKGGWVPL